MPNLVVEWLEQSTLSVSALEVSGSDVNQEIGYSNSGSRGFLQSLQMNVTMPVTVAERSKA
jgi:hypothetical protein